MAVVKVNYVKQGREARARAKATIRYIQHRPGKEHERATRRLFGPDGFLERHQVYRMIDDAPHGTRFFRIILSPDPRLEDTKRDLQLWELTVNTMELFEQKLQQENRVPGDLPWVAVEHNDHSRSRHIHAMLLFSGTLRREDIAALRQMATDVALAQRRERDLLLESQRQQERFFMPQHAPQAVSRYPWKPQAKPLAIVQTCYRCGEEQPVSRTEARRCSSCGAYLPPQRVTPEQKGAQWG